MTPQPPTPAKKSSLGKGCLIAFAVLAGLGLVGCLIVGGALWYASRTEGAQKFIAAVDKGVKAAENGLNAPGTKELRAAGCAQAMVIDLSFVVDLDGALADAGPGSLPDKKMVACQDLPREKFTSCDELAKVYAAGAQPTQSFILAVHLAGGTEPECTLPYAPDGTPESLDGGY